MNLNQENLQLGARLLGGGRCEFTVWAPFIETVEVVIVTPPNRTVSLAKNENGYHTGIVQEVEPGAQYFYSLDGEKNRPDPASRYQPQGVHQASEVVSPNFPWTDNAWKGLDLTKHVIYELHVGTFTPEGTFDAIIPRLRNLKELGVTALEIMPVSQFPGDRNWGYDGVHPFSVQNSYGGPEGLKRLVNACHKNDLAVVMDVVYNHFGPEGNYISEFGPYFTDHYKTPWGQAVNFDGPYNGEVRRYFFENALMWVREYHIDALRLDAVHAITDFSAKPFLSELSEIIHNEGRALHRRIFTIAESDLNDSRLVLPTRVNGFNLDAQWSDDFHHALHALLTREKSGYYEDFGSIADLAKAFKEGFVYTGQYSRYRRRCHGNSPKDVNFRQLIVAAQNHDQVGNRMLGERLSQLLPFEKLKLAAGAVLLSPFIPLLFMGEEYGETAPFLYFVSHSDPVLAEAVRRGRKEEFSRFAWRGEVPDPQSEETFRKSKLNLSLKKEEKRSVLFEFYRELLRLRKKHPALNDLNKRHVRVRVKKDFNMVSIHRESGRSETVAIFHLGGESAKITGLLPKGRWSKELDSSDSKWLGSPSMEKDEMRPDSVCLFSKTRPRSKKARPRD